MFQCFLARLGLFQILHITVIITAHYITIHASYCFLLWFRKIPVSPSYSRMVVKIISNISTRVIRLSSGCWLVIVIPFDRTKLTPVYLGVLWLLNIFCNSKPHKRDSKLAENKKCPIRGDSPRWANCEYRT